MQIKQIKGLEKLKGIRHIEWIALAIVIAIAILLLGRSGTAGGGDTSTDLERRMERVLSAVEGAGQVRVMVNQEQVASAFAPNSAAGKVTGVLVVAEGAGDLKVALALAQAVQSLTGVDANDIEVLPMGRQ